MTVTMTAKNQITLPKKITDVLGLKKGTMFTVEASRNSIELIPLVTKERTFTEEEYRKLDALSAEENGKEERLTKKQIGKMKRGKM